MDGYIRYFLGIVPQDHKQVGTAGMDCQTSFLAIYSEPERGREWKPSIKHCLLSKGIDFCSSSSNNNKKKNISIMQRKKTTKRIYPFLCSFPPRRETSLDPHNFSCPTNLQPDSLPLLLLQSLLPIVCLPRREYGLFSLIISPPPLCEIAPIHEISNLKENPFGDGSNHSIEADKEGKEEKKIQFVSSTDVQSTEIAEQDEKGGDQGRKKQEEEAEAEDDGILCAICQSTDGDPADPIVFCDGCDLMVHSTCYGNPLAKGIPEDDWFCSRCLISRSQEQRMPISCCLCPSKNGALKPTKNESWAHIVCALFVPEVFFEDPDGREGIDCSMVPKRRWGGKCYMCQRRKGCVIECSESKCSLAFHVTCALDGGLCIEYQEGKKKKETIVAGFCKSHTELWRKQQKTGKFKIVAREESEK